MSETQKPQPEVNRNEIVRHRRKSGGGVETYGPKQEKEAGRMRKLGRKFMNFFGDRGIAQAERERAARADYEARATAAAKVEAERQTAWKAYQEAFHPPARNRVSLPLHGSEGAAAGPTAEKAAPGTASTSPEQAPVTAPVLGEQIASLPVAAAERRKPMSTIYRSANALDNPGEAPAADAEFNNVVNHAEAMDSSGATAPAPAVENELASPFADYHLMNVENAPVEQSAPAAKAEYVARHAAVEAPGPFVDYQPVAAHEYDNDPPGRDTDFMPLNEEQGLTNELAASDVAQPAMEHHSESRTFNGARENESRHRSADHVASPSDKPASAEPLSSLASSRDTLMHRLRSGSHNSRRRHDTISGRKYTPEHAPQYDALNMPSELLPTSSDDAELPVLNETKVALTETPIFESVTQNRVNTLPTTAHKRRHRTFVNNNHRNSLVNH